ncbi:hypothetical protein H8I91_25005 [Serratia fonticola]|uniref:DUF7694 domain-containing protein n=1 Tax=Serratia fonticola TaxID=47917 RepID=UPI00164791EB|nr:hypothetical protein [Serratia fonticola]MBC3253529.1 hypothetical protein [Serratia fonticola]
MVSKFTLIDRGKWPASQYDPTRTAVYLNGDFLVQVFTEEKGVIRLSINTVNMRSDGRWKDGISWDVLQEIKNAVGYADRDAVEVYPAAADVVNVANIRHLWVMPEKLGFAWRRGANEHNSHC